MEIWKDIPEYNGVYQISNIGRVKSVSNGKYKKEKFLSICLVGGYAQVSLSKDKKPKKYYLHRLLAICFLNKPIGKDFINHINGIKTDNRLENLEWCTQKENSIHAFKNNLQVAKKGDVHYKTKIFSKDVLEIKNSDLSKDELATKYNVSKNTISRILNKQLI